MASLLAAIISGAHFASGDTRTFRYFYDDLGQLIRVLDSDGHQLDYLYDAGGNLIEIKTSTAPAIGTLAIFNFTPRQGPKDTRVVIQGQGFSPVASLNIVKFNGTLAPVISATETTLIVIVPATAASGPVTVAVGSAFVASDANFTFVAAPTVSSVSPRFIVSKSIATSLTNFQVVGTDLGGSSFMFVPQFNPRAIEVVSATAADGGQSSALSLTVAGGASGAFTLVATNSAGESARVPTSANTLYVIAPDADADGDGLSNAVEISTGSDPLNPDSDGDGLPDGWEAFYALRLLDPSDAGADADSDGLTNLAEFQSNTSPRDPNRTAPIVSQVIPKNGATGVFVNTSIIVRMAGPLLTGVGLSAVQNAINALLSSAPTVSSSSRTVAAQTLQAYLNRTCCGNSIVPGTVSLFGPNGAIGGSVAGSSDGLSVTFAPSQPLPANTTYTVQARNLRDAAGNLMTQAFQSSFKTGNGLDSTPPQIILTVPATNSTDVPTNVHYTVQFSKPIDPASLTAASFSIVDNSSGQVFPGLIQVDSDGLTAAFIPSPVLPIGRSLSARFTTAIKDVSGNNLQSNQTFFFTTGYGSDAGAPHLVATSPVDGENDVPVNALIDLLFNEPVNITSLAPNVQVSIGGQSVPVLFALSNGNRRATITPAQGLTPNASYTVTVGPGVEDFSGATLDNPSSFSFQTVPVVDKTAPQVVLIDPAHGSTSIPTNTRIRVRFSERMNTVTLSTANLLVYPASVGLSVLVPGTVTVSGDGLTATFTPTTALRSETQYGVFLTGITDLVGQGLPSGNTTYAFFITGDGAQTTPPTVVAVTPPNGATSVPLNSSIQLLLSGPVSGADLTNGMLTLTPTGGSALPGALGISSGNTVLTFTSGAALTTNTTYSLALTGVRDLTGGVVPTFTSTFTTGTIATADTTGPSVTAVVPINGAGGVAVTAPVVVTFSEPVNPVSVTAAAIGIRANNVVVAGSYSVTGATVTFTPATPWPGGASVTVGVNGNVRDLAGNSSPGSNTSFTTATTADTTAPTVIAVSPVDGASEIGSNGQIVVTFSESVTPSSLTACCSSGFYSNVAIYANGARIGFNQSLSGDNRTLTLSGFTLPVNSPIAVVLTRGVTDLSGNGLVDFTSQFTTAPAFDTVHATVTSQRPGNGATTVPLTSPLVLFVSEPLNPATVPDALHVSQNGTLVDGTVTVSSNGQVIQFVPTNPWSYGAVLQVFLDATATDVNGTTVTAYQGTFRTLPDPATTAPTIIAATVVNGMSGVPRNAVLRIGYSGPIDPATLTVNSVRLAGPVNPVPATLGLDATGTVIELTPSAPLVANTNYCYYVNYSATVLGPNGLPVQGLGWCFSTGSTIQTTAPTIVAVSPAEGLTNVPVNANVRVVFSAPIDPLTVTAATIALSGGGQPAVAGAISFGPGNQSVVVMPQGVLPSSTALTLTLDGVRDTAGNAVPATLVHFTTGNAPATAAPGVVSTSPSTGATDVPVNAVLAMQTNGVVDLASLRLNPTAVVLRDNTTNQNVVATPSLSLDGTTVFLLPSAPLAVGRSYTLGINCFAGGLLDVTGNAISGVCPSFTTGFAPSAAAPQVTGVSPADGLTQVPINARVVVQFNEPINAQTLTQTTLSTAGGAVAILRSLTNGNQTLILTPAVTLRGGTLYTVQIAGVRDLSGHAQTTPVTTSFTTAAGADFTQPTVVTLDPLNGLTNVPTNTLVRIRFSKQVAVTTGNILVYPTAIGTSVVAPGTVTLASDGLTATWTPTVPLRAATPYGVFLTGITDLIGQGLLNGNTTYSGFTTGASVQTTPPTVVAVTPPHGATNVPVNASVQLQLSGPIGAAALTSSMLTVTPSGGSAVAGTVTLGSNNTVLTWTPAATLPTSTTLTIALTGARDLTGAVLPPFTSTFTTSAIATGDTTGPSVTTVVPNNGTAGVDVTAPVAITFSEPVNPVSVNAGSVVMRASGFAVAGSYVVNGATVTFTPTSPWPGGVTVTVGVNGNVRDLAGNGSPGSNTSFTTATTADTTAPTVIAVSPVDGASEIGSNGQIVVTFSESVTPSSLTACCSSGFYSNVAIYANGARIGFNQSLSGDNRTLTLSGFTLPVNSPIAVVLTRGVTDLSGNGLVDFTSQFTTAPAFDTVHATVTSQRPGNGATTVPLTNPLVLFVSEPLNPATVPDALHVSQNGTLVDGTVTVSSNGQVIQFVPTNPWSYGAVLQVFLDATATDVNGTTVTAYQGTFRTLPDPATTAPTIIAATVLNGMSGVPRNAVFRIGYSGPIDPTTLTVNSVRLYGPVNPVPATLGLDATGTVIELTPSAPLVANTNYCYNVNYSTSVLGPNGLPVQGLGWCFTTGGATQTVAPTVVTLNPADGLVNIPVNANVRVVFSGPIDPLTVTAATIALSGDGQTAVPSSVTFSNNNQTVVMTPQSVMPGDTAMTLTIVGIKDRAGNTVSTTTVNFTTGHTATTVTPLIINSNPTDGAANVPTNVAIAIRTNTVIDLATVTTATFRVHDNTINQDVSGVYSLSPDGSTIYLLPAAPLATGRTYTVNVNSFSAGLTDVLGNLLHWCCGYTFTFTTGVGPSTTGPKVSSVSPVNAATQVPINARVTIQFDQPVDVQTLDQVTLTSNGGLVPASMVLTNANQTLILVPLALLRPNTQYAVNISGVADLSGVNVMTPTSTAFTTGPGADFSLPQVMAVSPISGATGVAVTTSIVAQFTKSMNAQTITSSTFRVTNNSIAVSGTISVAADGKSATFTPAVPLAPGASYTVTITSGVLDLEGLNLTQFQSIFSTL